MHTDFQHLWTDPEALLDWGFSAFHQQAVVQKGQNFGRAPRGQAQAQAAAGLDWLVGQGQKVPAVQARLNWPRVWRAGEPVGSLRVGPAQKPLAVIPLLASRKSPPLPKPKPDDTGLWAALAIALGLTLGVLRWRVLRLRRYRYRSRSRYRYRPRRR